MLKSIKTTAVTALLASSFAIIAPSQASAWSCQAQFEEAQSLIADPEKLVNEITDARILALLAQAKDLSHSGIISHNHASEGHTGETGKHMHSNAPSGMGPGAGKSGYVFTNGRDLLSPILSVN